LSEKKRFEFEDHVADVVVVAYGDSLEEAFENAALALFEVMTDTTTVEPRMEDVFEVEGFDELSLLYSWIETFIVAFDVDLKLYSTFKIEKIEKTRNGFKLRGKAWGETFNPAKHPSRSEVKAVTYHEMEILRKKGIQLRFILDL
jgi:SHS2 domain-containing protein